MAQNNSQTQLKGTILIHTSNKQDIEGYVCLELSTMSITNSWDEELKKIASIKWENSYNDSIAEAQNKYAIKRIQQLGLWKTYQYAMSVNPTCEFAINYGAYGDGDIVNLQTGDQFKFKELLDAFAKINMHIYSLCWSSTGKKIAIAGFDSNEKPYYLIEIDLYAQKVISFYKYEKAIMDICYDAGSDKLAVLLEISRVPWRWLWGLLGGHGMTYYDYYFTIFDPKKKSVVMPEVFLFKDARHGASLRWIE